MTGKAIFPGLVFLTLVTVANPALSRTANTPADQNGAMILGEAGEQYAIYGTGGIRVTGGHHGFWASNMKHSPIEIDGTAISMQKLAANYESADFNASGHSAYFVSQTAVCTLPPAAAAAGEEIVVCNTNNNTTITYQVSNGDKLISGNQPATSTNSTLGRVDRFISDGISWYRE
jgi:hypothetical protein